MTKPHRAIVADNDTEHSARLAEAIEAQDWRTTRVTSLDALSAELAATPYNLAVIALQIDGVEALPVLETPTIDQVDEIIVMGEEDDPATVRRAINKGASYFFCKPFDAQFFTELLTDLTAELNASPTPDPAGTSPLDQFGAIRGSSRPMKRMFRIMRKVASSDASVLLIGESGTGKELAAQTIHSLSKRAEKPLLAMNCGAIPQELFESELFGHEKGSFTGAAKQHKGFFERADGGTLFLDELTEMPLELQVKLLRVLEVGRFRRVGGETDLSSDVRILAATNRDPMAAIESGNLREDLYYRVASFPLTIPPLRKRHDDVIGLAQFFLGQHNAANDTAIAFDDSALDSLRAYPWPGNVRELMSAVERAYVMANDVISPALLPTVADPAMPETDDSALTISVGASIDDAERQLILATLKSFQGDKKAAAETLGISLKTLYNRLNEYGDEEAAPPA